MSDTVQPGDGSVRSGSYSCRRFIPIPSSPREPFVEVRWHFSRWASKLHEQGQSATHHNLLNHTCDIDGDVAAHTGRLIGKSLFVGRNRDETNWVAGGRYIDRLERREGSWRIALRTNAIEWSGLVPTLPIPFADVPDIGVNGVPGRGRGDPSYYRPLINKRKGHIPTS